jgi:GAF domain-containing protein/anti-sigma regulatory factor (Ser/Thr protein kinase)
MRGSGPRYGPVTRTVLARYGVVTILALSALALARLLMPLTDDPPYALLVGAVAVAIWYGGFAPGLLTVAVAWSLSPIVLTQSGGIGFAENDAYRWWISMGVGLLVVWVSLVMRRGHERAATAAVAAEASTRQMETLQQLAKALSAAVTPSDVARELLERAPTLLGARGGALGLIDGDDLVIVDPQRVATQTHRPGLRLPLSTRAPITRAAAEGTSKRVDDRATFEAEFPDGAALTTYAQAALAVPLRAGGDVVGSMSFLFDSPGAIHEEADAVALIVADLGGQALERSRLYERELRSRQALDRILRVAPRLYSGSPEEVGLAICREARHTVGADFGAIWRVRGEKLELLAFDPANEIMHPGLEAELALFPRLLDTVNRIEVSFVPDILEEARGPGLERARRLGLRSSLRAPVSVGGRPELVLIVSWQNVISEPESSTVLYVRRLADQAGLAIEQLERRQAEAEAARRALETRRLLDTTAALAAATTPTAVTEAIVQEGVRGLGAASALVACRTEDGTALEIVDSRGYDPGAVDAWRKIPLAAPVPLAEAVRENRLVKVESAAELEARYPALAEARAVSTNALLVLPLSSAGSVLGAAGFSFTSPRSFTEAELEFAEALARQSGQALERALLLAAEYDARVRAEDMVLLTSALSQALNPADIVHAVAAQLLPQVKADVAGIYLLTEGTELELVDTSGGPLDAEDLRRLAIDRTSPPGESARRREAVWVETEGDWQAFAGAGSWLAAGVRTMGTVPLVVDQRLLGVLLVGFRHETAIELDARKLVDSVARLAGQPLERAWLMEREQAARVLAQMASRRTRRLQSTTQALAAAPAPRDVATILIREAVAAVSGDAAALFTFDRDREAPELLAQDGLEGDALAHGLAGPVIEAALAGSILVIDDDSPTGPHASTVRSAIAEAGLRRAVCVPLGVGNRPLGSLLVGFRSSGQLPAEDTALLQTLARIGAQTLERSRLLDDEQRLRRRSERTQLMTEALSGSLTQRDVAEVVVDTLVHAAGADGSALSIIVEERQLQKKLAWRGYDDVAQEPWLEIPLAAPTPGNRALKTRSILFYETLEALGTDFPETVKRMDKTGHESFLFVPLIVGGVTNGLLITSWVERIVLQDEDRAFIETLASQSAQALDRARRYESERTIAETLQRSVLPMSLPRIPSVQLAARYLPGTDEVDVGGDWFDAVQLPNGRLGLAVGDVVGKGVQSAATMGQLRNALRAFALDQMKPSTTMQRLNRLTEEMGESPFATVIYAVLDPDAGMCRFASAGHPPPLAVYPDGRAEYLEGGRGVPLGTGPDTRYTQHTSAFPVGSSLLLYTDGLIERRGESIDRGLERLLKAAQEGPGEPERLVEHIVEQLIGGASRGDDIALLAVRLLAVAPKPLRLRLPRDSRSLDLVRDALRVWLQDAPVTQLEAHDIVLATWEACANAVEHPDRGANGSFQVRTELHDSLVRVSVKDTGRWLPERERPDRGLGLRLIRSVMTSVEIDVTEKGTTVRLEKALAGDGVASLRTAR